MRAAAQALLRPFGAVHIAALALLGCLAVAWHTGEAPWRWLGLLGAVATAVCTALLLRRKRGIARSGLGNRDGRSR
jgi:LPXTG-motif cell wall-anchored protein